MEKNKLMLEAWPQRFCIARFESGFPLVGHVLDGLYSWTATPEECSLLCEESALEASPCQKHVQGLEPGYRLLRVVGPLDFALTGILSSILLPLAKAQTPVFVLSTYDTDYILCKEVYFEAACSLLQAEGFAVRRKQPF